MTHMLLLQQPSSQDFLNLEDFNLFGVHVLATIRNTYCERGLMTKSQL